MNYSRKIIIVKLQELKPEELSTKYIVFKPQLSPPQVENEFSSAFVSIKLQPFPIGVLLTVGSSVFDGSRSGFLQSIKTAGVNVTRCHDCKTSFR
jgi:hypothetical protein